MQGTQKMRRRKKDKELNENATDARLQRMQKLDD